MFEIIHFYLGANSRLVFIVKVDRSYSLIDLKSGQLLKNFGSITEAHSYLNKNCYRSLFSRSDSTTIIDNFVSCCILFDD